MPCCRRSTISSVVREFAIKCRLCGVSASCRCNTYVQGGAASGDSSGGENISRPGLRSGEPSGFRSDAQVCKFQATNHSVNACAVSSRGFGSAAGFSMFHLWVQEGTATATLSATLPDSVAESFLHVGNAVVRRQDTPRARVQVVEPFVGHMRVVQVFDPTRLWRGVCS